MYPFPATLDGKPVRVYQLTGDHALIAHANGKPDKVLWSSLLLPVADDGPAVPLMLFGEGKYAIQGAPTADFEPLLDGIDIEAVFASKARVPRGWVLRDDEYGVRLDHHVGPNRIVVFESGHTQAYVPLTMAWEFAQDLADRLDAEQSAAEKGGR